MRWPYFGIFGLLSWLIFTIEIQAYGQDTLPIHLMQLVQADQALYASKATNKKVYTVIDYSRSIYKPRLWVVQAKTGKVLFFSRVSHAFASGDSIPTAFSNVLGSEKTSLGVYRTAEAYWGSFGYSMRVDGLCASNNNARKRAIVFHPDPGCTYSLGCFMLPKNVNSVIIDSIKGGSLVFVYKPKS
jgi:hypothetical protein